MPSCIIFILHKTYLLVHKTYLISFFIVGHFFFQISICGTFKFFKEHTNISIKIIRLSPNFFRVQKYFLIKFLRRTLPMKRMYWYSITFSRNYLYMSITIQLHHKYTKEGLRLATNPCMLQLNLFRTTPKLNALLHNLRLKYSFYYLYFVLT